MLFTTLSFYAANCGVPIRRDSRHLSWRFSCAIFRGEKRKKRRRGKKKKGDRKRFSLQRSIVILPPSRCFVAYEFSHQARTLCFFPLFLARREYRVPQRGNLSFCSTANRLMPEIYRQWWSCLHVDKLDFSIITYFPFFFFLFFYRWTIDRSIEGLKWWWTEGWCFFEKLVYFSNI